MVGARPGSVARVTEHTFHGRQVVPDGEEGILVSLKSQLRMQIRVSCSKGYFNQWGKLDYVPFFIPMYFCLDNGCWPLDSKYLLSPESMKDTLALNLSTQ